MERLEAVRSWVFTLSFAVLALAVLLLALRPWTEASATEGGAAPSCHVVDNDLTLAGREKLLEHLASKTTALLADRKGRDHVTVVPVDMMANGGGITVNIVCLW